MFGTWFSRIALFTLTNLAVVLLIGLVLRITGLDQWINQSGTSSLGLLAFSAVFGFAGSFFSLVTSKWMAKRSTGAQVITSPQNELEAWLVRTVEEQASKAGIGVPEIAIYDSPEPNAFATGARRDSALVAVSTGLLRAMGRKEVEAVLAHEISHVANGDMITLTLLQGVVNTFVFFFSRVIGRAIDTALSGGEERRGRGMGYFLGTWVAEIALALFANIIVMWYSRRREFRADAGAAALVGPNAMVRALQVLGGGPQEIDLPKDMAAFGIRGRGGWMALFSSHPSIEDRIQALQTAPAGEKR